MQSYYEHTLTQKKKTEAKTEKTMRERERETVLGQLPQCVTGCSIPAIPHIQRPGEG